MVYELRDYLSHGPEAANAAVGQLDSVSLTSTDPDAVDKFLDTLEALAAKAGSLVNDVTLINRIEANRQVKQFEAYLSRNLAVVTLQSSRNLAAAHQQMGRKGDHSSSAGKGQE